MLIERSRNLMASGGNEPMSDGGKSGYSVFANAFLIGLNKMSDSFSAAERRGREAHSNATATSIRSRGKQ